MRNTILSVVLSSIMATTGMQNIQAQTSYDVCEHLKENMIEWRKYLDDYQPWFKPALEKLWFTNTEKEAIFNRMCELKDEKSKYRENLYFARDKTTYEIMQSNLSTADKKILVLRLILGEKKQIVPSRLESEWQKYNKRFESRYLRVYENRAKVDAYLQEQLRILKKDEELLDWLLNK